jgi:site-specific recombinase XerD
VIQSPEPHSFSEEKPKSSFRFFCWNIKRNQRKTTLNNKFNFAFKKSQTCKKRNTIQIAFDEVVGFSAFYRKLEQKVSLSGNSKSTLTNYARHLAQVAIHFDVLPTKVESEQINEYLYYLQQTFPSASDSYFKFTVYSLRFAYRMEGLNEQYISLPSIKREKKLPVVLSREEVRRLLAAPKLLKHRVLIGLLYGCGLRCFEARNITIPDIDFDRMVLHVRQGKGKKDRYVPLSAVLADWLKEYICMENPTQWLFNGRPDDRAGGDFDSRYSNRGIHWAVQQAAKKVHIIKRISVHTLRHTFATHLLEDGLDIVSIKDLLGHSRIETTLIYLHVAQYDRIKSFSPLDTLYPVKKSNPFAFDHATSCVLSNHIRECPCCSNSGLAALLS